MHADNSIDYLKPEHSNPISFETSEILIPRISFGKCIPFWHLGNDQYKFIIGPHWYISIIGFMLIFLFGGLILIPVWDFLSILMRSLYLTAFASVITVYLVIFLSNPGVIPQKVRARGLVDIENSSIYACKLCLSLRTDKAYHCEDCDVCIAGLDHHCVWVGKCVGAGNLVLFYVFVGLIPSFLIFAMFTTCFANLNPHK